MYVESKYIKYTTQDGKTSFATLHTFLIGDIRVDFQEFGISHQNGIWPIDDWAEKNLDMIPRWKPGWNPGRRKWEINGLTIQRKTGDD